MQTRLSVPRQVCLWVLGLVLALMAGGASVLRANVALLWVRATAQTDTINVEWQTASELGTSGFRLYRTDTASPSDWGAAIYQTVAKGDSITGAQYLYVDGRDGNVGNVQPNVRYYYLLEEVTSSGGTIRYPDHVASAGIGVTAPTGTATATITSIVVGTPTYTRTPTATPTGRQSDSTAPTATRQFPNSPTPPPTATFNAGSAFTSGLATPYVVPTIPAPTVGAGSVTSPTPIGGIPLVQPTTPVLLPSATPTVVIVAMEASATPTFLTAGLDPTVSPTLLLRAREGVTRTPQVFEPSNSADRRATPEVAAATRDTSLSLALGGGAVVLAVLLGAGGYAFWHSRRH